MKWLIDAQLPRRLSEKLNSLGHDSVHSLELANGNRSTDIEICHIADQSDRIVASKDRDFLDSHIVNGTPRKLLWITLGNTSNNELLFVFERELSQLVASFAASNCVEMTPTGLAMHE